MSEQVVDSQGREIMALKMKRYLRLDGDRDESGKQERLLQYFGKPFRLLFSKAALQNC